MFSPPSERRSHVLRFELTTGCDWGRCTYCHGYEGVPYREKPLDEYKCHVDDVWKRIGHDTSLAKSLRRVFIGNGNALSVPTAKLIEAIRYTAMTQCYYTGSYPKRTAIYGSTRSINNKEGQALSDMRWAVPNEFLIFWGVESGSTDVLRYVRKGCTKDDILKAAHNLDFGKVKTSVMIMPGLGGVKYYDQHVSDTAEVLGVIKPVFLTFMGINPTPCSDYAKMMAVEQAEGTNRPLNKRELAHQTFEILKAMSFWPGRVGSFDTNVDCVSDNALVFNYPFDDPWRKQSAIRSLSDIKRRFGVGGVVVKDGKMYIGRLGSGDQYYLPLGLPELHEDDETAARRAIAAEINVKDIEQLGKLGTISWGGEYPRTWETFLFRTRENPKGNSLYTPKWVTYEEALMKLTRPEDKNLIVANEARIRDAMQS